MAKELIHIRDILNDDEIYVLDSETGTAEAVSMEDSIRLRKTMRRFCILYTEHLEGEFQIDECCIAGTGVDCEWSLFRLHQFLGEKAPKDGANCEPGTWSPAWVKLACAIIDEDWKLWLSKQKPSTPGKSIRDASAPKRQPLPERL